jgi:protein-S-isoprenylcysteine O-methyltransferase Ste14
MFLRALLAFLALPGIVAFAIPIYWVISTSRTVIVQRLGLLPLLLGWAVSFGTRGLYWYALFVGIAFHVRVVIAEEPWLRSTHGATWDDYARRVRRWL